MGLLLILASALFTFGWDSLHFVKVLFIIGGLPYMSPALFLSVAIIFLAFASAGTHLVRVLSTFGFVALHLIWAMFDFCLVIV